MFPAATDLRDRVKDALNAIAEKNRSSLIPSGDWTRQVFVEIKERLVSLNLDLEYQAFRRRDFAKANGFIDQEFIYDFTANFYSKDEDHFLIQTVVAGESEWSHAEASDFWDFHKLLQSDALLCFYIFEPVYEQISQCFDRLIAAIVNKQSNRRRNNLTTPAYLLSCRWNYPQQYEFRHKFIDSDGTMKDL
jgi:hypothetical protein